MTVRIIIGDVRAKLKELPTNSVDCVVTSPPYWGLRDYGTATWIDGDPACDHAPVRRLQGKDGDRADRTFTGSKPQKQTCSRCGAHRDDCQIGLEQTLGEHLEVLVDVFREVRRVMKPMATLWLNYGDCYAAAPNGKTAAEYKADGSDDRTFRDKPFSTVGAIYDPTGGSRGGGFRGSNKGNTGGAAPGRIVGLFDANYSRSPRQHFVASDRQSRFETGGRIVAAGMLKPKDLCMIPNRLAIALQDDGWWIRSEIIWHKPNPMPESVYDRPTMAHEKVWLLAKSEDYFYNHEAIREPVTGGSHARASREKIKVPGGWDVEKGAHGTINRAGRTSATYRDLPGVTPKSAPEGSNIKAKGSFHAAIVNLVETRNARNVWTIAPKAFKEAHFATFPPALAERCIKAGTPTTVCAACGAIDGCGGICEILGRKPGHVLDPFGGAGTVGLVAEELGLDCTIIELNPEYAAMADRRIKAGAIKEAAE